MRYTIPPPRNGDSTRGEGVIEVKIHSTEKKYTCINMSLHYVLYEELNKCIQLEEYLGYDCQLPIEPNRYILLRVLL